MNNNDTDLVENSDKASRVGLILLVILAVAIIGAVTYIFIFYEDESESVSYALAAATLYTEYREDEVIADAKYKDKYIQISGTIKEIRELIWPGPYIVISDNQTDEWGIQCLFDIDNNSQLLSLQEGQSVEVIGQCDGYYLFVVRLIHCNLQQ